MSLERRRIGLSALLLSSAVGVAAAADGEWQEAEAPAPPALRTSELIHIEVPRSELRFGVQPDSVSIGADDVVRYTVVATSRSGAVNAMYEGIRCVSGEVKVYARHIDGTWAPTKEHDWQSLHGNAAHRHSLAVARQGACVGRGANRPARQILRDLAAPVDERFVRELR
ncbi:CNP1-like family protein [Ramlibacter sp. AN1015]|uniref:CNP1-like family protein n=1 Tax=Ramlibacter sp. AN1015 TaxID=3133428 RepID=UPI0030BDCC06